jgi:broad-specificity NMP kinase
MAAPLDLPGLILVTGTGPGTGKSSTADALFRQLRLAGKPVHWIYESDFFRMDALRRFNSEAPAEDPAALDSLLAGVQELVAVVRDSGDTWIIDSLVPVTLCPVVHRASSAKLHSAFAAKLHRLSSAKLHRRRTG